jgi:hypothetical protein
MPTPTHINDQIRAAAVAALTGLTTTGNRVDEDALAVRAITQPRLVVKVETDGVETGMQGQQQRTIKIIATGYAKDAAGVAATLGAIQYEVEVAMHAAGTLGGLLSTPQLIGDERGIDDIGLEKPVGYIAMTFAGLCFTRAGYPGAVA